MKKLFLLLLFCVMSAFVLPLCVYQIAGNYPKETPFEKLGFSDEISVFLHKENKVVSLPIEEYICGVVLAEMPASFESEALKAQAVAARSYAAYKQGKSNKDHPGAAVCTDYTHCKAYIPFFAEGKNAENPDESHAKILRAVSETKGEVLTYEGNVALTVFHSQAGGGRTENSADVWGGELPYLVSVESHGEEQAPNFYSNVKIECKEFEKKLRTVHPEIVFGSAADIGEVERSEGGSVKNILISGKKFSGKEIRALFGLRSNCFKISADENYINFEVSGYGHGVGMSQYGANAMAKEGASYKEILYHYYTGTQILCI